MSEVFACILYDIVFGLSNISHLETTSSHLHDPFISEKKNPYEIKAKVTELVKKYSVHPKIENKIAQELGVGFDLPSSKSH